MWNAINSMISGDESYDKNLKTSSKKSSSRKPRGGKKSYSEDRPTRDRSERPTRSREDRPTRDRSERPTRSREDRPTRGGKPNVKSDSRSRGRADNRNSSFKTAKPKGRTSYNFV